MARKAKAKVEVLVERMNARQFKKELIADVAESWVKHGKRVLHLLAHEDPVRYAALIASLVPKQELPEEESREITISWIDTPSSPPPIVQAEPPRAVTSSLCRAQPWQPVRRRLDAPEQHAFACQAGPGRQGRAAVEGV